MDTSQSVEVLSNISCLITISNAYPFKRWVFFLTLFICYQFFPFNFCPIYTLEYPLCSDKSTLYERNMMEPQSDNFQEASSKLT
jgi:hypothetical protein